VRFNIIGYFISEGFKNVLKNKKSTISCLGVMCATMLMFGLFFAIGQNITSMMKSLESQQGMQVFIVNAATDTEIEKVGEEIKQIDGVNKVEFISKEDAYNDAKKKLGDRGDLMEGLEPSIFAASYMVTLTDLNKNAEVQDKINQLDNIKKITSKDETINKLSNIGRWINIVTGVMLIILIAISVFIISNTIKLTVHARRKEISIMKYVGATNGFIRAPFIVEGIVIGIISGLVSILLVAGGYTFVADKIAKSSVTLTMNINMLGFNDLISQIIIVYMILGVGIGIVGSSLSMRKYLDV